MSEIRVKENESLESALKRFKRSCQKDGVIAEVKKREHYVSPSLKRKQKSEAARKNKRRGYCFPFSCIARAAADAAALVFCPASRTFAARRHNME